MIKKIIIVAVFMLMLIELFSVSLGIEVSIPIEAEKKIAQPLKANESTIVQSVYGAPKINLLTLSVTDILDQMIVETKAQLEEEKKQNLELEEELNKLKEEEKLKGYIIDNVLLYQSDKHIAENISDSIMKWSTEYSIDPLLVLAVGTWESSLDPWEVGYNTDTGIMQIIPSTGKGIAKQLDLEWNYNMLFDIDTNIRLGTYYLSKSIQAWDDGLKYEYSTTYLGLIGYNRGIGRTAKELNSSGLVTTYVDKVWPIYEKLKENY